MVVIEIMMIQIYFEINFEKIRIIHCGFFFL